MGRAIALTIQGEYFPRKEDVEERVRALILKYNPMTSLTGPDEQFCLELFKYHPRYTQKCGVGILRIQVRLDKYGKKCFHLLRVDGSDEDISWTKCVAAAR